WPVSGAGSLRDSDRTLIVCEVEGAVCRTEHADRVDASELAHTLIRPALLRTIGVVTGLGGEGAEVTGERNITHVSKGNHHLADSAGVAIAQIERGVGRPVHADSLSPVAVPVAG